MAKVDPSGDSDRTWFDDAGLGVFIHWDHIAQQECEISWPIVGAPVARTAAGQAVTMSVEQYHSTAGSFDPHLWDADEVAAKIARTGAAYAVLTARHHDGYCMYHSGVSDFGIASTRFGRDITAEYVTAIRAAGLKVGLYYSLPDWHHPDYPAFTDNDRPYPDEWWPRLPEGMMRPGVRRHRRPSAEAWRRYRSYLRAQLTELLTNYGTIDLLWFDGDWERSPEEWDATGLRSLIKSLQPAVLINDRLPASGGYRTPEQGMPAAVPDKRWELCLTMGKQWSYRSNETKIKSPRRLVAQLAEVASLGGNLLLNIGPGPEGTIPDWQNKTLEAIGQWMTLHGESIRAVRPAPGVGHYGPVTTNGSTIFLHLIHQPVEELRVRSMPVDRVRGARLMATGEQLQYDTGGDVGHQQTGVERLGDLTIAAPRPSGALHDVIAVDLKS